MLVANEHRLADASASQADKKTPAASAPVNKRQSHDKGTAAGAGGSAQPAIHELFAKAQLQACGCFVYQYGAVQSQAMLNPHECIACRCSGFILSGVIIVCAECF